LIPIASMLNTSRNVWGDEPENNNNDDKEQVKFLLSVTFRKEN